MIVEDKRSARKTFSRVGIAYTSFFIIGLFLQLGIYLIVLALRKVGITITYNSWLMIITYFLHYGVSGSIIYLVLKDIPVLWKPREKEASGKMLIVAFLASIGALYLGSIAGQGVMKFISFLLKRPMINPINEVIQNLNLWTVFLIMVLMAPICEEIIFRKILIDRIRQYGDKTAIIVSAVIFGLCHGNFYQFFYAFGIGLVFGYVYIQTGRIRYTITFHMIINFLGSMVFLLVSENQFLTILYSLSIFSLAIAGITLFIIHVKNLRFESGMENNLGKGNIKLILLNIGMVLFVLSCVANFIISEIG